MNDTKGTKRIHDGHEGGVPLFQVDAFTDRPFAGNPAAVCVLPSPRSESWMQQVAAEMNLSETAFLVPRDGPEGPSFDLRWFTPAIEVALCGHATLASAHALWDNGLLPAAEMARFHTKSGLLTARRDGDWIELNFPATPAESASAPDGLLEALGASAAVFVGKSRFDYLVEVDGESIVHALAPDFVALRRLPVRGITVTSRAADGSDCDFVSRFFAPASGVDEDPVTGSAHCCLTPYWSGKLGRTSFIARQVSARGGFLRVTLDGDRVRLSGRAVTIMRGHLDA